MSDVKILEQRKSSTLTRSDFEYSQFDLLQDSEKVQAQAEQLAQLHNELARLVDGFQQHQRYPDAATHTIPTALGGMVVRLVPNRPKVRDVEPSAVPLHALVRFGAGFVFILCLASLGMWLLDWPAIITPFAALLGVVVSPFFYAMGSAIRSQTLIERDLSDPQA